MPKFSVIIPVYNRPQEVDELLGSLTEHSFSDFEIVFVEDGSTEPCKDIIDPYKEKFTIIYHFKENSGPGDSRNVGMTLAKGEWFIFFDSDCLIPAGWFEAVEAHLAANPLDAFGGPDAADPSFNRLQKAINFSMTSFLTTGGVRGKKKSLDTYQPRSFNMGLKREVFEKVGGFGNIHPGEDPDLSYRIMKDGFKTGFIPGAKVFHKRRINFKKFYKQVYKFGVVRPILMKWHPEHRKLTYFFPSLFLVGSVILLFLGIFTNGFFFLPLLLFCTLIFLASFFQTGDLLIAGMAIVTSLIQLWGYGWGFLKSFIQILLLGGEEKKKFPDFFFR
ncbi:MAG: glycosyltransferase [Saprospiraceae bacterium]|nr:glycosyltransferase [Saprospiraceae bacterium]